MDNLAVPKNYEHSLAGMSQGMDEVTIVEGHVVTQAMKARASSFISSQSIVVAAAVAGVIGVDECCMSESR